MVGRNHYPAETNRCVAQPSRQFSASPGFFEGIFGSVMRYSGKGVLDESCRFDMTNAIRKASIRKGEGLSEGSLQDESGRMERWS